jgi:hypothetical protein
MMNDPENPCTIEQQLEAKISELGTAQSKILNLESELAELRKVGNNNAPRGESRPAGNAIYDQWCQISADEKAGKVEAGSQLSFFRKHKKELYAHAASH